MPWLVRALAVFYLLPAGYVVFLVMQSLPPEPSAIEWFAAVWSLAAVAAAIVLWVSFEIWASRKALLG